MVQQGMPIEQINTEGKTQYLHHDQQGSTRLITSSTGTVEATFTYDGYGNVDRAHRHDYYPLGYDAQYTSPDTELIYMRARTYDPTTAQFLSIDPLAAVTHAPYSYTGDDPLSYGDPTGLAWQVCVGGTVSLGLVTFEGNACYVNTPGGSGLAVSGGTAGGLGFGANVHLGAGGSNAQTPAEYGGIFGNVSVSAEGLVGGYTSGFVGPAQSCGAVVAGGTAGVTAGLGVDAGLGGSYTYVVPF